MRESIYGGDYSSFKSLNKVCNTVGELKELLNLVPDNVPLNGSDGLKPTWCNVGINDNGINGEHLYFERGEDVEDEDVYYEPIDDPNQD